MSPEETSKRRYKESQKVAELLDITYDVWDIDDCTLVADLDTRWKTIRYIREFAPDLIIAHRTNDYHADHRASGQLVQDASYLLTVPHTCPDTPAMRYMPVIMYNEDAFKYPPFEADYVFKMDDVIHIKLEIAHINESQVYEWLPYTHGDTVPEGEHARREWLKGINITQSTTDEEILAQPRGYASRFAKTAIRFRDKLIERYGEEGKKIRYAEAFQLCEYGRKPTKEFIDTLFNF